MASAGIHWDSARDQLIRAIVDLIGDWPEGERRIFVAAHYKGQNPERISRWAGIREAEVRHILERCERKLHAGLRRFRYAHFIEAESSMDCSLEYAAHSVHR